MATEELLKELLGTGKKKDFDVQQYVRILLRKKHLILNPLVLSWIISVVGLNYVPDTYLAVSSVAIEPPPSFTREFQLMLDQQRRQRQDVSELNKVRAEIYNQKFLGGVIEALGLDKTPIIRERAQKLVEGPLAGQILDDVVYRLVAREIAKRVEVHRSTSGVYNIRTESHDPDNAFYLNQVIAQMYVEARRRKELAEVTAKGDFSDEQVAIHKEKLYRAEQELERFRETQQQVLVSGNPVNVNNVILAEEVMNLYREELKNIEGQVGDFRAQLRAGLGMIPTNEQLMANQDLQGLENKQIHAMLQNLVHYLARRELRGGETITQVIEDAGIGRDRQSYRDKLVSLVSRVYASRAPQMQEDIVGYYYRLMLYSSFQEIVDTLNRYITNYRQNISGAPAIEAELARRRAEVEKTREVLSAFQQQSTSAQITRAIQASELATRIEIRDHAVRPLKPIKPHRPRLQLIFVFLGFATGLGLVFIMEYLNRSFTDTKDIEAALGVPVLGTIPSMAKGPGQAKIQARKNTLLWAIAMVLFVVILAGMLYFLKGMNTRLELYIDREAVQEMVL